MKTKSNLKLALAAGMVGVMACGCATADVTYVAHAGEEFYAPPHSKAAYRTAYEHGLEYIKLDLHLTKDGNIVCNHDATLKASMDWDVKIKEVTLEEIRQHRFKSRGGYTNETIVTLPEALEFGTKTKCGVWLDMKGYTKELFDKAIATCDKAGLPRERIMIATWQVAALRYCQKAYPEIKRVLHMGIRPPNEERKGWSLTYTKKGPARTTFFATEEELAQELLSQKQDLGLHGFNLPWRKVRNRNGKRVMLYDTPESVIKTLKANGAWISMWFIENEEDGEKCRALGVDNFVTSNAARTRKGYRAAHPPKDKSAAK